jgi:hypothetical protein
MCDACRSHPQAGGRRPSLGWLPLAIIVLVGGLLLLEPLGLLNGKAPARAGRNLADTVFVRDLAAQGARGVEIGELLLGRTSRPRVRAVAAGFLAHERREQRAALALGARRQARAAVDSGVRSDESLLRSAVRHAREDLLLARIELRGGRDPRLRRLARTIATDERGVVARLASIR